MHAATDDREPCDLRARGQAFVLLRFTLLIATSYMLLAESGFSGLSPFIAGWIGAGLLSNVVATRLPRRILDSPLFTAGSLILDTTWVTVGLLATGHFEPEFFFLYFFVLFLAAVGESLTLIALGTVVVSGAYLYALSASGEGSILETPTLIRLPFLFAVASFYGYLVDRVRRERHRALASGADVVRLEEVRERLEAANARLEEEVAERRKAEEALSAANRQLTELSEMKSAFVSVVSHELRTPLTSIRNAIDLVRGGTTGALAPDQKHFLDMAKRNQERLSAIIDDLLDVSRIEAGRLEYRFEETDAALLVREVHDAMAAQALSSGVTLTAEADGPLPVWGDPKRLHQVLVNLAGNALKFTPDGGRVTLSARRVGDEVELAVTDSGAGVPEEEREKIFEAFYQVTSHGQGYLTRKVRGTGLGLSISRELSHAQGGRLRVEAADPPPGSRFVLSLPADLARAREIATFEEEVREHRKYPLFGVLVIGWREDELAPGSSAADPKIRYSALLAIRDELRRALPRDCDLLRIEPAHDRIVLVLLATPREGTEIVMERLNRRLASLALRIGGDSLPVPRVRGPAQYPEDGATGRALVARCLEPIERPNPEVSEGADDDHADDPGGRRRARRPGDPELPAVPGGLLGGDGDRWSGGAGRGPGAPAGPGAARRHDAA